MARARKPCDFCSEDTEFLIEERYPHGCYHGLYYEIDWSNRYITFISQAEIDEETDEVSMDIKMNYCPVCGRKI